MSKPSLTNRCHTHFCRYCSGHLFALLQYDSQRNKILHVPGGINDADTAMSGASSHHLQCHYRLESEG